MKTLRLLAALMFLATGVIHLIVAFLDTSDQNFWLALAFGILYLVICVLLLMNVWIAIYMGLIPIFPFIIAPFIIDFNNLDWRLSMFPIELVAVVLCIILLIKTGKKAEIERQK